MVSSISRWDGSKNIIRKGALFSADSITDLRTTDNTLSVWKADTEEDINDAIVALALNREKVQNMACLLLDEQDLVQIDISIDTECLGKADGINKQSILNKHRNLIALDFWQIAFLTEYMLNQASNKDKRKTYTKEDIKQLLIAYKNANKIDPQKMLKKLRDDLKW